MTNDPTRGTRVTLVALLLHIAFTVVLWIVARWAQSMAARTCAMMLTQGLLLWIMTAVLFYARQLAHREAHEIEALAQGRSASIFQDDSQMVQKVAEHRLESIERFGVPAFTLLWAALSFVFGFLMIWWQFAAVGPTLETEAIGDVPSKAELLRKVWLGTSASNVDVVDAAPATLLLVVVGFVAFLLSFYVLGMAREEKYRPLRSPGSFLLVTVVTMAAAIVALILAWQGITTADFVVSWIAPALLMLLSLEMVIAFILNFYRPRREGVERRLCYDSRLFNLIAEPRQIGKSVADTLNYQFGFEVSQTWFYQLIQKAFVPLLIFGVVVLIAISSVVIVPEGQHAVVTTFGLIEGPVRQPGLHFKWPWPAGKAIFFDGRVRSLTIGAGHERGHHPEAIPVGTFAGRELILWTKAHGDHEEQNFLLAVPPRREGDETPSVDIIKLVVTVQYQVVDPIKFGYQFVDADEILHRLVSREMVRYCSSATLFETNGAIEGRPEAIMTTGREAMRDALKQRIETLVSQDPFDLGIEIVSVNLQAVHPPAETAKAFEDVLAARLAQQTQLNQAHAAARREYIKVVGDVRLGQELALALRRKEELSLLASFLRAGKQKEFDRSLAQAIQFLDHSLEKTRGEIQRELLGAETGIESDSKVLFDLMDAYRDELTAIQNDVDGARSMASLQLRVDQVSEDVDALFVRAGGRAAVTMAEADAFRWQTEMGERARASTFPAELKAWQANRELYELDRYLAAWDSVLPRKQKYVICIDPDRVELRINLEQSGRVEDRLTFEGVGEE